MVLTLVRIELMLKTDETVDVEDIDEAVTEERLAKAQFDNAFSEATSKRGSPVTDRVLRDETEDEMVNECKQISTSDN